MSPLWEVAPPEYDPIPTQCMRFGSFIARASIIVASKSVLLAKMHQSRSGMHGLHSDWPFNVSIRRFLQDILPVFKWVASRRQGRKESGGVIREKLIDFD